ncbi:hypothetical protein Y032_0554g3366 [Ancylostoma ceylanicum]|nr:hypothetical protein Y032_0554g3366 [Ancylostoma ceylanicum]
MTCLYLPDVLERLEFGNEDLGYLDGQWRLMADSKTIKASSSRWTRPGSARFFEDQTKTRRSYSARAYQDREREEEKKEKIQIPSINVIHVT